MIIIIQCRLSQQLISSVISYRRFVAIAKIHINSHMLSCKGLIIPVKQQTVAVSAIPGGRALSPSENVVADIPHTLAVCIHRIGQIRLVCRLVDTYRWDSMNSV